MAARLEAILGHLSPFIAAETATQSILMGMLLTGAQSKAAPKLGSTANPVEWTHDLAKDILHQMAAVVQNSHDAFGPAFRDP
ncbi:hypothetical protein EKO04_003799 [Ascochyta lentis]|uniref:Uncharacterized protein n=1 Tax=Ascochyta lentis TaxID=205686 RepID=A0A8H7J9D5_9PLEO|nr:hypothetical protein EKO04_003799 [Ascochyta lentis]